jgi:hypothetical protein
MIEPYQAVGLIQTMRGIRRREESQWNLELYLDRAPYTHVEYREQVTRRQLPLGSGRERERPGVISLGDADRVRR